MTHKLKILQENFIPVASGNKAFEVRKNDRNYQRGDKLILQEFTGTEYTGNEIHCSVSYIFKGGKYGLAADYCVLGIRLIDLIKAPDKE